MALPKPMIPSFPSMKYFLALTAPLCPSPCKKTEPAPVDQMSPATRTGANAFGCLLNGRSGTPSGFAGLMASYRATYDAGTAGGTRPLQADRIVPERPNGQYLLFDRPRRPLRRLLFLGPRRALARATARHAVRQVSRHRRGGDVRSRPFPARQRFLKDHPGPL